MSTVLTENPKVAIKNHNDKISAINWTLIVLLSFFLRTFNLKNDIHFHPDERFIMMTVFDFAQKGLEPPNFNYGLMPFYALYFLFRACVFLGLTHFDFDSVYIVGRVFVAILFVFQLIYLSKILNFLNISTLSKLLVLWLFSLNPFMVQQYRFFSVDPFLTLFMTAAVYYALKQKPIKLGVSLGLAFASKATALVAPVAAGIVVIALGHKGTFVERTKQFIVSMFIAIVTFALTNPFFLIQWSRAISNTTAEIRLSQGLDMRPYTMQFLGTESPWYQLEQLIHTIRPELLIMAALGGITTLFRRNTLPVAVCLVLYFLPALTAFTKFPRYFMPAIPLVFVLSALFLESVGLRLRIFLGLFILFLQILTTASFVSIYLREHPYWQVTKEIKNNFKNTTVGNPVWDDTLPIFGEEAGIKYVNLEYYGAEEFENFRRLINQLNSADLVIFPTQRIPLSFARAGEKGANVSKLINVMFEDARSASPKFFEAVIVSQDPPKIFGIQYLDYCKDESLTVYQYPRSIVLRRKSTLDLEEVLQNAEVLERQTGRFDFTKYCHFYREGAQAFTTRSP